MAWVRRNVQEELSHSARMFLWHADPVATVGHLHCCGELQQCRAEKSTSGLDMQTLNKQAGHHLTTPYFVAHIEH